MNNKKEQEKMKEKKRETRTKEERRKIKKIALISIAAALLLTVILLIIFLPVTYDYDKSLIVENDRYNVQLVKGEYTTLVKTDEQGNYLDDEFKILSFTNFHLDTYKEKGDVTIEMMIRNIVEQKPDLVVFTGDNITSAINERRAKQLGRIMEDLGVYWTLVLGNHEGDNLFSISRQRMINIFASFPMCLVEKGIKKTSTGQSVWGAGNHVINISDSKGAVRQSLYFIDGGADMTKKDIEKYADEIKINNDKEYDYVKDSQIQWYVETTKNINEKEGTQVKSIIFCHIPLVEFHTAFEAAQNNEKDAHLIYGDRLETVSSSGHNSGLFDEIRKLGCTQAVITGHDHINDFFVEYKGIILGYNQNSGYSSYNAVTRKKADKLIQGFSVYEIGKSGQFKYASYKNADLYPDMQEDILKLYR